jgi:hypothetical protein
VAVCRSGAGVERRRAGQIKMVSFCIRKKTGRENRRLKL